MATRNRFSSFPRDLWRGNPGASGFNALSEDLLALEVAAGVALPDGTPTGNTPNFGGGTGGETVTTDLTSTYNTAKA